MSSPAFRLDRADLRKLGIGLLLAFAGAAVPILSDFFAHTDFGLAGPLFAAVGAVLVNAIRKFVTDNTPPAPPPPPQGIMSNDARAREIRGSCSPGQCECGPVRVRWVDPKKPLLIVPLLLIFSSTGCGSLFPAAAPPPKVNIVDKACLAERQLVARVWWEASQQEFASDVAAVKWLKERWEAAQDEAWGPVNRVEQRYLGSGKWNPSAARKVWRKLAIAADPAVELSDPLDELSIDEDEF